MTNGAGSLGETVCGTATGGRPGPGGAAKLIRGRAGGIPANDNRQQQSTMQINSCKPTNEFR